MTQRRGFCFYCGTALKKASYFFNTPRDDTEEHVYPLLREHRRQPGPPNGLPTPIVRCCRGCNDRKADMHPLDWLGKLTWKPGREALSALLVACGEDQREVATILAIPPGGYARPLPKI